MGVGNPLMSFEVSQRVLLTKSVADFKSELASPEKNINKFQCLHKAMIFELLAFIAIVF